MNRPPVQSVPRPKLQPRGTLTSQDRSNRGFTYQYVPPASRVNPILEQPKLIFNSAAQPISTAPTIRHVITHMRPAARFLGRWFYAGFLMNKYQSRDRMSTQQRSGQAYQYTPASTQATGRTVRLLPPVGR